MMLRVAAALLATAALASVAGAESSWSVEPGEGSVTFKLNDVAVARYVYQDPTITRPYFCDLRAPSGVQVSRNHPPVRGEDRMDHPDYHPGVWLAFGDINRSDSWRLKTKVRHIRFVQKPTPIDEGLEFATSDEYFDRDGAFLCLTRTRHAITETPDGVLLTYDVTFLGDREFVFGDQEEMGLGIRLATPLRVEVGGPNPAPPGTGEIAADGERRGTADIWGLPARWLDYRGQIDETPAGMAIFCHPKNFRATRMHARDYGFVCANPFALKAFDAGESSSVHVRPGESLRLRYGVLLHSGVALSDAQLEAAYESYTQQTP